MAVYGPVHILPYDPQCHELCAIYYKNDDLFKKLLCVEILYPAPIHKELIGELNNL